MVPNLFERNCFKLRPDNLSCPSPSACQPQQHPGMTRSHGNSSTCRVGKLHATQPNLRGAANLGISQSEWDNLNGGETPSSRMASAQKGGRHSKHSSSSGDFTFSRTPHPPTQNHLKSAESSWKKYPGWSLAGTDCTPHPGGGVSGPNQPTHYRKNPPTTPAGGGGSRWC